MRQKCGTPRGISICELSAPFSLTQEPRRYSQTSCPKVSENYASCFSALAEPAEATKSIGQKLASHASGTLTQCSLLRSGRGYWTVRATKRARLGSEGHALLLDHQRLRARSPSHPRDRISPATICWARQGFSVLLFLDAPRGSPLRLHLRTGIRTEGFKLGCVCMLF